MELREAIRRRRMVRRFDPRPLPAGVLDRILESATHAPSAGFSQGLDLVVLEGPEAVAGFWRATADPRFEPDGENRLGVSGQRDRSLFAAFAFSLNFIVPFIIGDYSTFDFALIRHLVSALVGLFILFSEKHVARHLPLRNVLQALWLAFVGYVGYFLTVTGAAIFAGPVIAPAFLGLVPIVGFLIDRVAASAEEPGGKPRRPHSPHGEPRHRSPASA